MKSAKGNSVAIITGAIAGAVLMALAVMVVLGLKTGIAGGILVVLLIMVASAAGWLVGMQYRIREINYSSYQKGYHAGLAKRTVIFHHPDCSCSFTLSDRIEKI